MESSKLERKRAYRRAEAEQETHATLVQEWQQAQGTQAHLRGGVGRLGCLSPMVKHTWTLPPQCLDAAQGWV